MIVCAPRQQSELLRFQRSLLDLLPMRDEDALPVKQFTITHPSLEAMNNFR